MKIRNRLTFQFTIIVASILLLFSLTIYFFSANYRQQEFYRRLQDRALTTAKLLIQVNEVDNKLLRIIDRNTINALYDEKIVVYDSLNKVLYSSIDDQVIPVNESLFNEVRKEKEVRYKIGESEAIGFLFNQGTAKAIVIASAYDQYGIKKLIFLKWILVIAYIVSIILVLFAGWFFSNQAMKPISNVVDEVEKISISNLNSKVNEGNGSDEIAHLAITFNKMLERLRASFELQKNFVSNASHELRTPLTAITGQIDVTLLNERTVEEYKLILQGLALDIRNMNDLTNRLLELAQANRDATEIKFQPIRIDEVLLGARSELIKRFPEYSVTINFEIPPENESSLMVSGNEQLLKSAFINLMDNGCKFSQDKSIEVILITGQKKLYVKFIDNGIGIPANEIKNIFEPFFRTNNSKKIAGHGLGLSLTQKIIQLHNGELHIISELNKGTLVTVSLECK